jgi:hypothetical protein
MNDIRIPQHVIQRLERRWMGKLEQLARIRSRVQPAQPIEQDDPLRSAYIERWLASSLRPPDSAARPPGRAAAGNGPVEKKTGL